MCVLYCINDSNDDASNKKSVECQYMTRERFLFCHTDHEYVTAGIEVTHEKEFCSVKYWRAILAF